MYSTGEISPEARQKPVGNEGEIGTDYIRVLGFHSGTRLGGRIADPNSQIIILPRFFQHNGPVKGQALNDGCDNPVSTRNL